MQTARKFNAVFQDEVPNSIASDLRTSSLATRKTYARVNLPLSRWVSDLHERFDELAALPRGWDGYDGHPVSFNCLFFTKILIERLYLESVPAPQLVPGGDGTVQVEWHRNQFDVEIDVLGPNKIVAVRRNIKTGEVQELLLDTDFTALESWIVDLSDRVLSPRMVAR